jgi:hypothetical protein
MEGKHTEIRTLKHIKEEFRILTANYVYITLTLCRSNLNPYCMGRKAAFFSVGI